MSTLHRKVSSIVSGVSGPPGGDIAVLHAVVPGRIRIRASVLYRNAPACAAIARTLRESAGVRSVVAHALTGDVVAWFDPQIPFDEMAAQIGARCREMHADCTASVGADAAAWTDARVLHLDFAARDRRAGSAAGTAVRAGCVGRPRRPAARAWHALEPKEVLLAVGSSMRRGLSDAAAQWRRRLDGPNCLAPPPRRSAFAMFVDQLRSLPVMLLAGSALASLAMGGFADALVILGVVLINGAIGYATEAQTERAIGALNGGTRREAIVLRSAALRRIDAAELVVGDILVLGNGAYVPADARVLEARELCADESALTGESVPVPKTPARIADEQAVLAERASMLYMGTAIVSGSGLAAVVAIGDATELGTIQTLVGSTRPPATPMQLQLERFGNQTVRLASAICVLVFGLGLLRGLGLLAMFKASVALAVAAVPEGLPTVATTTLALGIRRMRSRKMLVRRLDAVETLGAVHTVCFDKTGTLTFNRMSVLAAQTDGERMHVSDGFVYTRSGRMDPLERADLLRLLHVAVLCNETEIGGGPRHYRLNGSSTEAALVELALAAGVDVRALRARHPLRDVAYRTQERSYMCTLHAAADGPGRIVAVKGNPLEVLALCTEHVLHDGRRVPLVDADRAKIAAANREMAGDALRVLGFAYARGGDALRIDTDDPRDAGRLCWIGMLALADPVRDGARELIALLHGAGIKPAIITGDQAETARAVGAMLGIGAPGEPAVIQPAALAAASDDAFARLAQRTDVFARVSAAAKLRIIRGLQQGGRVVAMVGDGINDGPALKAANISVAMGRHGTDLARDVADVVLEDDGLETLTAAISQGRTFYDNIRKSVHFLLSTNLSEIMVTLAAVGAGLGQPLTPMQLLWINLLSDVFPGLALAMEPPEPDVLQRPPRDPAEPIIGCRDMARYGREALVISSGALASRAFSAARHGAGAAAGTVSFMTLTLGQLLHAYGCRSDAGGALNVLKRPRNRRLDLAIGGSVALQLLACVIPGLRSLLGMTRIDALDALAIVAGAVTPYLLNDGFKPAPPAALSHHARPASPVPS